MQRRSRKHLQKTGFTLIELLVAVSVLALMLFLINKLFMDTTIAASTSMKQAGIVANARSIGEQLSDDAGAMVGPDANFEGGYIIIANSVVTNPAYPNPRRGGNYNIAGYARVDQLYFVRDGQGLASMTPQNAASFGSNYRDPSYARVFYGHVERTNRDGSVVGNGIGDPYIPPGPPGPRLDSGLDSLGTDWILGRQAQLFYDAGTQLFAGDAFASGPLFNSAVSNRTSAGGNAAYMGLTDIVGWQYEGPGLPATSPGVVGEYLKLIGAAPYPVGETTRTLDNYLLTTYIGERLKVNPAPTRGNFSASEIAQTHGMLAGNCAEFRVQFAADLNNDGFMDVDTNGNGVFDTGVFPNGDAGTSDGNIIWYDGYNLPNDPWAGGVWTGSDQPSPYNAGPIGLADYVFVFRVDDAAAYTETAPGVGIANNSKWPHLIRITYRLCDDRGRITTKGGEDLLDNDSDGFVDAADSDEAEIAGRYFEHIIRVPRP